MIAPASSYFLTCMMHGFVCFLCCVSWAGKSQRSDAAVWRSVHGHCVVGRSASGYVNVLHADANGKLSTCTFLYYCCCKTTTKLIRTERMFRPLTTWYFLQNFKESRSPAEWEEFTKKVPKETMQRLQRGYRIWCTHLHLESDVMLWCVGRNRLLRTYDINSRPAR